MYFVLDLTSSYTKAFQSIHKFFLIFPRLFPRLSPAELLQLYFVRPARSVILNTGLNVLYQQVNDLFRPFPVIRRDRVLQISQLNKQLAKEALKYAHFGIISFHAALPSG